MKTTMQLTRNLVASAALLTGLVATTSAADRSYVSGNFILQLDGGTPGIIQAVEGGDVKGEVVTITDGTDLIPKKQIGAVKYEDFKFKVGAGLGKDVYDWISSTVDGAGSRKNGAIIAADFNLNAQRAANFENALISEITIPAGDGASKEPGYLTMKVSPELIKWNPPKDPKATEINVKKQKTWVASSFRLDIGGLDCSRVSKIDSFTIKQKIVENAVGEMRDAVKVPGKIEYPNLVITIPAAFAETWLNWSEDFLVKGNNGDDQEKDGTLSFLSQDLSEELVRVSFHHLGVARVHRSLSDAKNINTVTVELYAEGMEIDFMAQFKK